MKFNVKDLDIEFLKQRAFTEAKEIHSKESTRRGRSLEEIKETCLYGHAAEVYLITHQGFKDNPLDYTDVKTPAGKAAEIKVTQIEQYVPYVLKRCNEAAREKWRNYPAILYIFIGNKDTLDYHLYGRYCYNGIEFVKETND